MKKLIALFTSIVLLAISCLCLSAFGSNNTLSFKDVTQGYWAMDAIDYLTESGVISGYEDGTFKPDNNVTREELATLLDKSFKPRVWQPSKFSDVDQSRWSAGYIGNSGSYISSDKAFYPEENATREIIASSIVKAMGYTERESTSKFTDMDKISTGLVNYVGLASEIGIIKGNDDGSFGPLNNVTRAEAAAMIYRALNYSGNPGYKSGNIAVTGKSEKDASVVYMTKDISSKGLMDIYQKLNWKPEGKVGVKLSTGEAGGNNYLHPELIGDLVKSVDGTIIECNTAYGGSRANTAAHLQTAKDHGFTSIANVDIMDSEGSIELPPVPGSVHLKKDIVGSHLANYDSILVLSHFKGHAMGGFGGALKNISIGIGSQQGKVYIHSGGKGTTGSIFGEQNPFLESMAEAAGAVMQNKGNKMVYISVMNRLSVDCDCDSHPAEPTMADIGILASKDPVALDKACVDLVYASLDGKDLINRMESRNGTLILDHAQKLGIGSQSYKLVSIDD